MNEIIEIKVLPVLKNSIEDLSIRVKNKIDSLGLEKIPATEENKAELKKIRTSLRNELLDFENQRKSIKEFLLKDYNEFEDEYKSKIKKLYENTDSLLKAAIDKIQAEQDQVIKDYALLYFEEMKKANPIQEVEFKNIQVNYANQKQVRLSIDNYFDEIKKALDIIKTYGENQGRLYASWIRNGYRLVDAITILNNDLAVEARVKKETEERQAREEALQKAFRVEVPEAEVEGVEIEVEEHFEDDILEVEEIGEYKLSVKCTYSQLADLMEFLMNNNYDYDLE